MALLKKNEVFIIGTLVDIKTDVRTSSENKKYISGKLSIKVVADGVENVIDVSIFSFEKTKDGADSKMFKSYCGLDSLLGKRVRVNGSLGEGSIVDEQSGDVRHFNQINARFINAAYASDTEDKATFEYSGFVVRELYERKDREDNLLGYRIDVAQATYNDDNCIVVRFDVNKDDIKKAETISTYYTVGSTVEFSGILTSVTTTETRTVEADFGEPMTKTFAKTEKGYVIVSGNLPIDENNENAYNDATRRMLVAAYKEADTKRVDKARNAAISSAAPAADNSAAAAMNSITRSARPSLI